MSTFGEELRRERELRGISLREICEATKISLRHLESLERNDFQQLPGGVFNRGFVRAYAEFIGVDPEAMVNAYLLEEQTQRSGADPGVLRPKRERPNPDEPQNPPGLSIGRALAWGVVLLVVIGGVIGGIYYYLQRDREAAVRDAEPTATQSLLAEPISAEDQRTDSEHQAAAAVEPAAEDSPESARGEHVE